LNWQQQAHGARRARNVRKTFYREIALRLARTYDTIVLEPLDQRKEAQKVNEATGEKSGLTKKTRAGRAVAALYELESAIRWAAVKNECALLELTASTSTYCALCGGEVVVNEKDTQILHCTNCGAALDRKRNGAALAWQEVKNQLDTAVADYWIARNKRITEAREASAEKLRKLREGRKKARILK
jgi:transposase